MTDKHKFKWGKNLPYMPVRRFIAERLRAEKPSVELDRIACRFLKIEARPITKDLDVAISAIPDGWWWHLSHLEAEVVPTRGVPGIPVSNGTLYDFYGKPVGFTAMCLDREDLPRAMCEALLKARYDLPTAFVVEASMSEHVDYMSRMMGYSYARRQRQREKKPAQTRLPSSE